MAEAETDRSDPRTYSVDPETVVAVYLDGTLRPAWENKVYPEGYYHSERCADVARTWFLEIKQERPAVTAKELDWDSPYHCEVCEESIT